MKLLDPFSCYRLAHGNSLLLIAYFLALIAIVPYNEPQCQSADYHTSRVVLTYSHITVFLLSMMEYVLHTYFDQLVISKALNWFSILIYQGSFFFVQTQYFNGD